uniref:Large polyvalent protein associated domain-containing protein n=1 Tax=Candidatus Kentrum sp. TC TaxID=2126339 RepID=A0A451A9N1_9GAMM|nr:MAG: hypothetical protein BECKTC1821F_GA0114240_10799 [Candidatus Kentron sp. TC]
MPTHDADTTQNPHVAPPPPAHAASETETPPSAAPGLLDAAAQTARNANDLIGAAFRGGADALENAGDMAQAFAEAVAGQNLPSHIVVGEAADNGVAGLATKRELEEKGYSDGLIATEEGSLAREAADAFEPETLAGELTKGITQFAAGWAAFGPVVKGAGFLANPLAQNTVRGALTDATVFDPQAKRLSNLINTTPMFRNAVTEYLEASPDDSDAEGRFKNALEGMAIGGAVDTATRLFKSLREILQEEASGATNITNTPRGATHSGERTSSSSLAGRIRDTGANRTPGRGAPLGGNPGDNVRNFSVVDADSLVAKLSAAAEKRAPTEDAVVPTTVGEVFNFSKMDSSGAIEDTLRLTADAFTGHIEQLIKSGRYTFEEMQRDAAASLADMLSAGKDPLGSMNIMLAQQAEEAHAQTARLLAGKTVIQALAENVDQMVSKIVHDPLQATLEDGADLLRTLDQLGRMETSIKALQASAARATASGRIDTGISDAARSLSAWNLSNPEGVREAIEDAGGLEGVRKLAEKLHVLQGNVVGKMQYINNASAFDKWHEFRLAAMLSGPTTHIVNTTSNAIQAVLMPLERIGGGVVSGDKDAAMEGAFQLLHLTSMARDAVRLMAIERRLPDSILAAREAFRQGENILDVNTRVMESRRGAIAGRKGELIRAPLRLLAMEDEYFKQINYRAALRARLMIASRSVSKDAKARARWVEEQFKLGFDENGRAGNTEFAREALEYTREATFTSPLRYGLGNTLQRAARDHPSVRMIAPFVRTPTNILRGVWQRTPLLNMRQRQLREDFAAGGTRRAAAIGKTLTGSLLFASATGLATEGRITGGGPVDPKARKILRETGWQPYAYVTLDPVTGKKTYTQYKRLDPVGMFFGLAADFSEAIAQAPEKDGMATTEAIITAIATNLASKSYLTGLTETANAITQPSRYASSWLKHLAASNVPTGLMQVANFTGVADGTLREARSLVDALMKKTPVLERALYPKRSWITGEPVSPRYEPLSPGALSPFRQSQEVDDPVLAELAHLGKGFSGPAPRLEGFGLNDEQFDKLIERTARPPGKPSLHAQLRKVFATSAYDIDRKEKPDAPPELRDDDPRVRMVDKIIRIYKRMGRELLKEDYPELRRKIQLRNHARSAVRKGNAEGARKLIDAMNAD